MAAHSLILTEILSFALTLCLQGMADSLMRVALVHASLRRKIRPDFLKELVHCTHAEFLVVSKPCAHAVYANLCLGWGKTTVNP